jgi:hypothetical protein
MIQIKLNKTYFLLFVEIIFGTQKKPDNKYRLREQLSDDIRKIHLDYLLNRTIWPMNLVVFHYDRIFEQEKNHEKTMEIIIEGLKRRELEATKADLLEVERNVTKVL